MDHGTRAPLRFRGSRRRLRQIRMRDYPSPGLWLFLAMIVVLLSVVVPYLASHELTAVRWTSLAIRR
jgi:hypothetical protein